MERICAPRYPADALQAFMERQENDVRSADSKARAEEQYAITPATGNGMSTSRPSVSRGSVGGDTLAPSLSAYRPSTADADLPAWKAGAFQGSKGKFAGCACMLCFMRLWYV